MQTVHIEVVVEDGVDTSCLRDTVAVEASKINGTVISDFEMTSTTQEIERDMEVRINEQD